MMNKNWFVALLKEEIRARKFDSIAELARFLDKNPVTVGRWMKGDRFPAYWELTSTAEAFQWDLTTLSERARGAQTDDQITRHLDKQVEHNYELLLSSVRSIAGVIQPLEISNKSWDSTSPPKSISLPGEVDERGSDHSHLDKLKLRSERRIEAKKDLYRLAEKLKKERRDVEYCDEHITCSGEVRFEFLKLISDLLENNNSGPNEVFQRSVATRLDFDDNSGRFKFSVFGRSYHYKLQRIYMLSENLEIVKRDEIEAQMRGQLTYGALVRKLSHPPKKRPKNYAIYGDWGMARLYRRQKDTLFEIKFPSFETIDKEILKYDKLWSQSDVVVRKPRIINNKLPSGDIIDMSICGVYFCFLFNTAFCDEESKYPFLLGVCTLERLEYSQELIFDGEMFRDIFSNREYFLEGLKWRSQFVNFIKSSQKIAIESICKFRETSWTPRIVLKTIDQAPYKFFGGFDDLQKNKRQSYGAMYAQKMDEDFLNYWRDAIDSKKPDTISLTKIKKNVLSSMSSFFHEMEATKDNEIYDRLYRGDNLEGYLKSMQAYIEHWKSFSPSKFIKADNDNTRKSKVA